MCFPNTGLRKGLRSLTRLFLTLSLEMLTPTVPILPGSTAEVLGKTSLQSPEASRVGSVFTWLTPAKMGQTSQQAQVEK